MSAEVVVVSCGMITPVGLSAPEVAASARARIQRLSEGAVRDRRYHPFVLGMVPDEGLTAPDPAAALLSYRAGRMLRMAEVAIPEALAPLSAKVGAVPLYLGLPELETQIPIDGPDLLKRLAEKFPIDAAASLTFPRGRASALIALKAAMERLAGGGARLCLVGGLDCQVDLYLLARLDLQRRIRNAFNPDGFAPSEGAGFLLLATAEAASKLGMESLAKIVTCSAGKEVGHIYSDEPYRGDGLAEVFTHAFEEAGGLDPVGCVYASFNGERYWGKEFGIAMLRNRGKFDAEHQMEHPAECFGDLGAAHGAVLLGLAGLGLKGGYRRSPTLVYSSSDFGDRAVTLMARS